MKNIKTFTTWQAEFNENDAVAIPATQMVTDVNTIINSLETLSKELTEELAEMEDIEVNEAGESNFVAQWITGMRAKGAQKKVNKIKMNSSDLEFAADSAEGDKKKVMIDKSKQIKLQSLDLQKMVDDKFKGKGAIVDRMMASTKIEGQLELIKRQAGMEDDPRKATDLKGKMKELANKYKEEQEAISVLKDDNKDELAAAKAEIEAEAAKKSGKEKPETTDKPTDDKPVDDKEAADKEAADKEAADKEAADKEAADKEAADKAEEEAKKKEEERVAALSDEEKEAEKVAKEAEAKKAEEEAKKKEEERVAALSDEEKEAEKVAKEAADKAAADKEAADKAAEEEKKNKEVKDSLITRANAAGLNELATEIKSKFDWQLSEGSTLSANYIASITKAESDKILNESKYLNLSVKERFARLL